jgi:hypothetical protein
MSYIVLIDVKDQWWSDQKPCPSFSAAQRHRQTVAAKWNDCGTAILSPDGTVLAFRESRQFEAAMKKH